MYIVSVLALHLQVNEAIFVIYRDAPWRNRRYVKCGKLTRSRTLGSGPTRCKPFSWISSAPDSARTYTIIVPLRTRSRCNFGGRPYAYGTRRTSTSPPAPERRLVGSPAGCLLGTLFSGLSRPWLSWLVTDFAIRTPVAESTFMSLRFLISRSLASPTAINASGTSVLPEDR